MRVSTAILIALSAVVSQTALPQPPPPPPRPAVGQPPRDVVPRPEPTGTGVIRGRVVTADTGSAVRRANVSLAAVAPPPSLSPPPAPGAPPTVRTTTTMTVTGPGGTPIQLSSSSFNAMRPRTMTTDSQGGFEFTGLPAGSYRITANPGQHTAGYLGISYGGKRPMGGGLMDAGTPIVLAEGQRFDKAIIALPKGAVITGRVTDENGDAMARVQIYTLFFTPGNPRGQRWGGGSSTDDLGHFRLYGLPPGEHVVVAEASRNTFVQPNAPPETEEDKIGFMTTYFPGTPDEGAAQRVRARTGAETAGLEIRMAVGRLFRISGMVTDSQGRVAARTNGQLFKRVSTNTSSFGFSTDEQGRFAMRNIPPGNYRLMVRGGRTIGPQEGAPEQRDLAEMANMPVVVNSDLEGLLIMTQPGAAITGRIEYEGGPPQLPPTQQSFQMRVSAMHGDPENSMGMSTPQAAVVTPDNTFSMRGLFGDLLLRASGPNMALKSVSVNGQDVTDTPREYRTGDQVTIVITTRTSTVDGIVTDAAGKPVPEAAILAFSEDKGSWRMNSTRTRRGSTDAMGKYRLAGLAPGRYHVVAIPRELLNRPSSAFEASFFEELAKEGTTFVVGEDEQRQVDLKVSVTNPGG